MASAQPGSLEEGLPDASLKGEVETAAVINLADLKFALSFLRSN